MSGLSKADYDYINLGVCIKNQADRLGIEHDGIPLEGVVVRIVERALAAGVVAEEPEWEYGNEQLMHSHTEIFPAYSEAVANAQAWLYPVHRRRKAGPWEPIS